MIQACYQCQESPVQTMQSLRRQGFLIFLKIQYKQLPFQVVISIQCTKRAFFF